MSFLTRRLLEASVLFKGLSRNAAYKIVAFIIGWRLLESSVYQRAAFFSKVCPGVQCSLEYGVY